MTSRLLAAATAAALLVGGCGRGQDPTVPGPPADSVSSTTTTTSGPPPPLEGAATTPVSTPRSDPTLLRAVRVAGQDGFDRVVFEFDGVVPGYRVAYVEPPITEDGSGRQIDVAGRAYIEVRMESASGADITGAQVREVYTGPDRVGPADASTVTEVVRTGDFEGVLTWVIGLKRTAPFRVSTLGDPSRVLVEVAG